jgi:hypothetical protein
LYGLFAKAVIASFHFFGKGHGGDHIAEYNLREVLSSYLQERS